MATSSGSETGANSGLVALAVAGAAIILGTLVGSVHSLSGTSRVIVAFAGIGLIAAITVWTFAIQPITILRFAFIGSFFFKADINFFKVNEVQDPSGLNISLTLVLALMLVGHDWLQPNKPLKNIFPRSFSITLLGLGLAAGASVVYESASLLGGFSLFAFFSTVFIAWAVGLHFNDRKAYIDLTLATALGILFTGVTAIAQYTVEFPTQLPEFGTGTEGELLGTQSLELSRVPAFLRTPTEMAWVVASLLPLVSAPLIFQLRRIGLVARFLLVGGALAGMAAIILSLARGSWIALAVSILLMGGTAWFFMPAVKKLSYARGMMLSAVLIAILILPFSGRIYERLTADDDGSAQTRVTLMQNAIRMIGANPIVGVGLNAYRDKSVRYDETGTYVSQSFPNPVHNVFVHIAAEIGVVGSVLFCALILIALYESVKTARSPDRFIQAMAIGLAISLVAFVISAMKEPGTLSSVRPPMRTLFLIFGLIFGLSSFHKKSFSISRRESK